MVHRDLKHDNILVEIDAEHEDGSEFIVCKLTDFGMAFEDDKQQNHNEICGTDTFMAPEVVRGQNQEDFLPHAYCIPKRKKVSQTQDRSQGSTAFS